MDALDATLAPAASTSAKAGATAAGSTTPRRRRADPSRVPCRRYEKSLAKERDR